MKHNSQRRMVTIEEHSITIDREDLVELVQAEDPEAFMDVDARSLNAGLLIQTFDHTTGQKKNAILPATKLIEMIRSADSNIPDDAEVCLAVRWRREVEVTQPPVRSPAAQPLMPAGVEGYSYAQESGGGESCGTCGGVPDIQGPTPDCNDALGCARVRATKGELGVVRTVEPEGAPTVGIGGGTPGTRMLVNRETGEKVFADKNGMPYGRHDDYAR